MLQRPAAFDHIKPTVGWPVQGAGPLTPPIYLEDRPFLSPIGYEISRPSSTVSTLSNNCYVPSRPSSGQGFQLPALSTLASLAAASVPATAR